MRKNFIFAGSGGQGVISMAILMANAYGLYEGFEVAQSQSYGAAARGGASQSSLVVSDNYIDYIEVDKADVFVAFNEAAFKKYLPKVKDDAIVFVDTTLIDKALYSDLPQKVFEFPATNIAEHQFRLFMANVVMMGFVASKMDDLDITSLEKAIADQLPARAYEQNIGALHTGFAGGKN